MKTIKLFKDNKLDKEYELTFKEILDGFSNTRYYNAVINGHNTLSQGLSMYMASSDGLNSSFDVNNDHEALLEYVLKNMDWQKDITISILAKHFDKTYEAMRQLKRKDESGLGGLWNIYEKAYKWDMSQRGKV